MAHKRPFPRANPWTARGWTVALLVMFGALCGVRSAAAETTLVIVTPYLTAPYMLPYYVAEDAGIFKKSGLTLKYTRVNSDQDTLRAILTGSGDVAIPGVPPVLSAVLHGAKVKVINSPQPISDYYVVLAKDKGSTLKDLVGKNLAISTPGAMPYVLPHMIFKKNHLPLDGTTFVAVGGLTSRLQAVLAGKVDGTILDTETTLRGEKTGKIAVVTTSTEQFPEGIGYCYAVATDAELHNPQKRAALLALDKGMIEGARLVMKDPDHAAEILYEKSQHDVDLGLLKATVRALNKMKVWGVDGGVSRTVYDFTMKTYLQSGGIAKAVPYDEAVDPTLAAAAVKALSKP